MGRVGEEKGRELACPSIWSRGERVNWHDMLMWLMFTKVDSLKFKALLMECFFNLSGVILFEKLRLPNLYHKHLYRKCS